MTKLNSFRCWSKIAISSPAIRLNMNFLLAVLQQLQSVSIQCYNMPIIILYSKFSTATGANSPLILCLLISLLLHVLLNTMFCCTIFTPLFLPTLSFTHYEISYSQISTINLSLIAKSLLIN